jgi:hypothetical protein
MGFCGLIEVGLCMRLVTHLTHELGWFEHFNDPGTALSYLLRCIAPRVLCCMFYFLCFIMKLFVTRLDVLDLLE